MEIIRDDLNEIAVKTGYKFVQKYSDEQLNIFFNYWNVFTEKEEELNKSEGISLEIILYSKYYWCTQFRNRFGMIYGKDAGVEQQQYKIIEEIDQRVTNTDWHLVQMIDEGNV